MKTIMIPAKVGLVSLVGVHAESYPTDFGNYFDFLSGERCLNMWAENLKNIGLKEIKCAVLDGYAFVIDDRAKGWTHDRLCVTGRGWDSRIIAEAFHELNNSHLLK